MKISDKGLDLIKEFEGYLRPLKDGGCIAYKCPAGVWTLGWGCTKGIKPGMTWTREQATQALRKELAECEAAATRMVTVPINQNQFDALVSFSYNCGIGALQKSTILRKLNKGDIEGAAAAFMMWDRATVNGRRVPLRGLTRRRAAERALFLLPADDAEPEPMPQCVEPPGMSNGEKTGIAVGSIAGAGVLAPEAISQLAPLTSNLVAVRGNTGQLFAGVDLTTWAVPVLILAIAIGALLYLRRSA